MKRTIRLSTFETNSSSSHSLIIADIDSTNDLDELDLVKSESNVIDIERLLCENRDLYFGDYGEYSDPYEKLIYLFVALIAVEERRRYRCHSEEKCSWCSTSIVLPFNRNIEFIKNALLEIGIVLKVPKVQFRLRESSNGKDIYFTSLIVNHPDIEIDIINHIGCVPDEFIQTLITSKCYLYSWLFSSNSEILCSCDGDNFVNELRGYSHITYVKGN